MAGPIVKLTLSAIDPLHQPALKWAKSYQGHTISFPNLSQEVQEWCDHNTPGYTVERNPAANFLVDVTFKNDRDAVLFKLFWL